MIHTNTCTKTETNTITKNRNKTAVFNYRAVTLCTQRRASRRSQQGRSREAILESSFKEKRADTKTKKTDSVRERKTRTTRW